MPNKVDKPFSFLFDRVAEDEIYHEVDLVKENVDKYVRTTQDQFSMENSFMVWQLAGTFTILAW
jgi:hypothetical protein